MKLDLHLNEADGTVITIDITDDSIAWSLSAKMDIIWPAKVISQISSMFPHYKLMTVEFGRVDNNPMTHLNGVVMKINAVWKR